MESGDFSKAERLFLDAIRDLVDRREGPDILPAILVEISTVYRVAGKFPDAEAALRKAVLLREEQKEDIPIGLAYAIENLCGLLVEESRYEEAKALAERAMALRRAQTAAEHISIKTPDILLGRIQLAMGKYEQAESILTEVLDRLPKSVAGLSELGPTWEIGELASTLVILSALRRHQGRYLDAEEKVREAVLMRERTRGPEASSVASALSELGSVLRLLRRFKDSEVAYRRSLLIRERFVGEKHPRFAFNLLGIGRLYFDQDGMLEAEELFRRAREIFENSFGAQNIMVARCDTELGRVYLRTQRLEQAERILGSAVAITESKFALGHPETVRTLRFYAQAKRQLGKEAEAGKIEKRAAAGQAQMDKTAVIEP